MGGMEQQKNASEPNKRLDSRAEDPKVKKGVFRHRHISRMELVIVCIPNTGPPFWSHPKAAPLGYLSPKWPFLRSGFLALSFL